MKITDAELKARCLRLLDQVGRTGEELIIRAGAVWHQPVGNALLAKLLSNAQILALTFAWDLEQGSAAWFASIVRETERLHRTIFEAIRHRDPAAARRAMEEHIGWARLEIPEHVATIREKTNDAG